MTNTPTDAERVREIAAPKDEKPQEDSEIARLRKAIDLIAAMDTFAPGMMEAVQIAREARDAKP